MINHDSSEIMCIMSVYSGTLLSAGGHIPRPTVGAGTLDSSKTLTYHVFPVHTTWSLKAALSRFSLAIRTASITALALWGRY